MIKKLRWKLTLFNSSVLLSILLVIVIFVYITANINVLNYTDNDLLDAAYQLKRYIPIFDLPAETTEFADLNEEYLVFRERMSAAQTAFGIWDENNRAVIYQGNFQISADALQAIRTSTVTVDPMHVRLFEEADGNYYIHTYNYEDINLRICTTITSDPIGNIRYIQTISNMNEKDTMADQLLRVLVLAGLMGITLSLVSGYFIAGRSIIPIQEGIERQKEFAADASHELRTPVTIVRTNLDALKSFEDETVSSQMHWIDQAYQETEHMEKLINDLLFLAKADLKETRLHKVPIELNKLLYDLKEKLAPIANEKKLKISCSFTDHPLIIIGDVEKIQQLFANIIMNAIQYSTDNETITIYTYQNKQNAEITIQDNGIGMTDDELENIFQRFYRADKARSRRAGGTGLGLPIAKWIAEAHKGSIHAISMLENGTTFIIDLPLNEGE